MSWFALIAGILGFVIVYYSNVSVPIAALQYLSLAALAGMDSLIGGIRAGFEHKFRGPVFVSGFIVNTLLAAFIAYLGELLGQNLALAVVIVLVGRIFVNLSITRRQWMDDLSDKQAAKNRVIETITD
jgi:small basic protein